MPLWRRACKPRATAQSGRPDAQVKPTPTKHRYGIPACSLQLPADRSESLCADAADSNMPALADLVPTSGLRHRIARTARHPCATGCQKDSLSAPRRARPHPRAPTPAVVTELTLETAARARAPRHPASGAKRQFPKFRGRRPCIVGPPGPV